MDYADGSSDYNYRVVMDHPEVAAVEHVSSQVRVKAKAAGAATLRVVSNRSADSVAEVKIEVQGQGVDNPLNPPYVKGEIKKKETPPLRVRGGGEELSYEQFIVFLYRDILHREADEVGKRYWTKMLAQKNYTRDEVREAFVESLTGNA